MRGKTKAKGNFKEAILAQPVDVEELGRLGRRKMVCPYYTARSAVPEAQLVLLPYSALLSQVSCQTRGKIRPLLSSCLLADAYSGNTYLLFGPAGAYSCLVRNDQSLKG